MKCAHLEALLCDYLDGVLPAAQRTELEQHLTECAACAQLARDTSAAVAFMETATPVEPPPELITRILYSLPAAREAQRQPAPGLGLWLGRLFRPMLQPRFAMGFAMTILSFSMLGKFAGVSLRQLTPADVNPVKLWRTVDQRLDRAWDRTVKFYESLRLVYEIQTRLREWTDQDPREPRRAPVEGPAAGVGEQPSRGTRNGGRATSR
ncbi:MAG: zf-HC2 domain-containing protein [Acidobacteria bacterium]|nr:zf-HC2 domain-containing protein [Acidobacteriota bacterium]